MLERVRKTLALFGGHRGQNRLLFERGPRKAHHVLRRPSDMDDSSIGVEEKLDLAGGFKQPGERGDPWIGCRSLSGLSCRTRALILIS